MSKRQPRQPARKGGGETGGDRQPSTPEEERELEKEELESFRRRQQWFDEVIGGKPESPPDSESESDPNADRKRDPGES